MFQDPHYEGNNNFVINLEKLEEDADELMEEKQEFSPNLEKQRDNTTLLEVNINELPKMSNTTNYYDLTLNENNDDADKNLDIIIHLPERTNYNRIPGLYDDLSSKYKKKHNNLILKGALTLKEKVNALILDGKKMRTTRTLMKLSQIIERIHIVEINSETFNIMKKRMNKKNMDYDKIQIYNAHIMDYVLRGIDPKTNVLYLDVMCNFFDSNKTLGTHGIIKEVLKQLEKPRIIFAATFCLRTNIFNFTYNREVDEILVNLIHLFKHFNYNYHPLIKKKEMRYNGQSHFNNGMMFVIYLLEKEFAVVENSNIIVQL